MTVRLAADGTIVLEDRCSVDDAETCARLLARDPDAAIDWRECEYAHTAVVQTLLAAGRRMLGPPRSVILKDWIEPILLAADAETK